MPRLILAVQRPLRNFRDPFRKRLARQTNRTLLVWLSPERSIMTVSPILHPTDFTPISAIAYEFACSVARDRSKPLVLLHVLERVRVLEEGKPSETGPLRRQEARDLLERMRRQTPDVWIETIVTRGDPASLIVSLARDLGCGLVVMGISGNPQAERKGGIAEQVARLTACPVLYVQSPDGHETKPRPKPEENPMMGGHGPERGMRGLP